MTRHIFEPSVFHNAIGAGSPVLTIRDGDTVVAATADAWGVDRDGRQVASKPNPMTGPFFVEGAEPGDTLSVEIVSLTPSRDTGWTFAPLAANVVDPAHVAHMPERRRLIWAIDRERGVARLAEPSAALRDWSVRLAPMIGCFGVAPAEGQAITTATSGPYGGNMDYRRFAPGATAHLPVFVKGALFYLGDGHACQGDGEISGTGIETSFAMEFTVRLAKGRTIAWPRGETAEEIFTVGNARPLDQALQHATTEMLAWLASDYGLDAIAASQVLGQAVRYDVANVFNPAYSVACRIARSALTGLGKAG
jgi:acetamidase/formamidase